MRYDLLTHIARQMAFSRATFGPGERTKGICDHIKKEITEIQNDPDDNARSNEWIDIILLGIDGGWRALEAEGIKWNSIPDYICVGLKAKLSKNEQRDWPDWRNCDPNKAIEHVRDSGVHREGWQPDLSIAPRNRKLLGKVGGRTRFIRWGKASHVDLEGWTLVDQGAEERDICRPTEWMEIPK